MRFLFRLDLSLHAGAGNFFWNFDFGNQTRPNLLAGNYVLTSTDTETEDLSLYLAPTLASTVGVNQEIVTLFSAVLKEDIATLPSTNLRN